MSQKDVELILMRQCASHLSMAIFLVDRDGRLIYYNEPAEAILGRSFDDAGEMMVADLAELFETHDEDGQPIPSDQLPLGIAMTQRRPAFRRIQFTALDGAQRLIEVTALPLEGEGGLWLGSAAFFWEAHTE
ncbi:MAG TPA: PAS domain-containing protein [Dehalococcoidia bacterium]|nr:PAS domain-containing protein [Dehalococcoidia bacterium]